MENSCNTNVKPRNLKEFLKSRSLWKPLLSISIGAGVGFLYYFSVGCSSGSCAITGSPYGSMIFGGFMGFFITNSPCRSC